MPQLSQVNLTDEELAAAAQEGLLNDPKVLFRLDSDSMRRLSKMQGQLPTPTLGDWMKNPEQSKAETGALLMNDLTDPKLMAGVVLSALVPKAMSMAPKAMGLAPRLTYDTSVLPQPFKAMTGFGLKPAPEPPQAPAAPQAPAPFSPMTGRTGTSFEPAPMPTPKAAEPAAPVAEPAAPPKPKNNYPDQRAINEAGLARRRAEYQARLAAQQNASPATSAPEPPPAATSAASPAGPLKLTAPEQLELTRMTRRGVPKDEAIRLIVGQREGTFGNLKTPTEAETRFPKGMRGSKQRLEPIPERSAPSAQLSPKEAPTTSPKQSDMPTGLKKYVDEVGAANPAEDDPFVGNASVQWARVMTKLRESQPRSLQKTFGTKGPSPEQLAAYEARVKEWNRLYRYASKMQKATQ